MKLPQAFFDIQRKTFLGRFLTILIFSTLAVVALPSFLQAQCTPSTAYFSGVADDALTIWINGTQLNTAAMPITYLDWTSTTTSPVYTFPVGILNTSGPNTIDVETVNTSASIVLSAWWIDIVCTDGNHTYITNDDGGYKMYDDTTGGSPPPTYSGNQWYQPGWVDSGGIFSGSPGIVPSSLGDGVGYTLKNLWNPATGTVLNPVSWNTTGLDHSANEKIYYSKTFTLTDTTYPPPSFTLTKTANVSANLTFAQTVTYTLKVCNSGGPISGPVTLVDTHDSHLALAAWPNSTLYGGSFPFSYSGGSPLTIIYQTGFGGYGACDTITYGLYAEGSPCSILNNAVTLKTLTTEGVAVTANTSYAVTMACPPTSTSTSTKTNTQTASPTLTASPTRTQTSTATSTSTVASTNTSTVTSTRTSTATATATNTSTSTSTTAFTNTGTSTVTRTSTGTSTATVASTATSTVTNTSSQTQTSTATLASTATSTFTNTPSQSQTSTATSLNTSTSTSTMTSTATLANSATDTVTQTSTATLADTATNTATLASTATNSPTASVTSSQTNTVTLTSTSTGVATNTSTATLAYTATVTASCTASSTATKTASFTPTATNSSVWTFTPSATPTSSSDPFVSKNVFTPGSPVVIHMRLRAASGPYSLTIFNSAGEHVKSLGSGRAEETGYSKNFTWDGTNKYGNLCSTGVYVIYLSGPLETKKARVIFLK